MVGFFFSPVSARSCRDFTIRNRALLREIRACPAFRCAITPMHKIFSYARKSSGINLMIEVAVIGGQLIASFDVLVKHIKP